MSAKPLPASRVVLEELYHRCTLSLEKIECAAQRDLRRVEMYWQLGDGEISYDEVKKLFVVLDDAADAARLEHQPQIESLWPYCERLLVAKAKFWWNFGVEAVIEGYAWMERDPWFANMVANGYALSAHGQLLHVSLLRKLQEELVSAIESLPAVEPGIPVWNSESGKLSYRGEVVRSVRAGHIAKRIRAILDAFQAAGWPERVPAPEGFDPQTLREGIHTLNEGIEPLKTGSIKFEADGTGRGVNCIRS